MGYSKTANPCPHNFKSTKVDVMFSVFISSSTETMGPSGCVAPDPKVRGLGTPEELCCCCVESRTLRVWS